MVISEQNMLHQKWYLTNIILITDTIKKKNNYEKMLYKYRHVSTPDICS